jgi:hypothetical protein
MRTYLTTINRFFLSSLFILSLPINLQAQNKIKISCNHDDAIISKVDDASDATLTRLGIGSVDFKLEKDSKNKLLVTKEGYEPVYVEFPKTDKYEKEHLVLLENREVIIESDHEDAMIFSGDAHVGTKTAKIIIPKEESVTVFVNKSGYVTQKFEFHNKPDKESPPITQIVSLKDRIVNLENIPQGALVAVGDQEPLPNITKIEVPFGKCVEITISKEGYAEIKKEYCNILGSNNQPPISQKVAMEDRVIKITVSPEDATIALNGKMEGFGNLEILINKGKCQRITVTKEGFITFSKNYCNQTNGESLPILEEVNLQEDEAFNVSLPSDKINTRLPLETKESLSSAEAWKILISIVTMEFDVLETVDFNAGYLITAWKHDSFNDQTFTARSRVIITNSGNTSENNYSIKMISQYGNGKPNELQDTDFKDWNRILKKYFDILDEIEMRIK